MRTGRLNLELSSLESEARKINNAGQVVGHSFYEVLWQPDGSLMPLASLNGGYESVNVRSLNDSGIMVGTFNDTNNSFPVLWRADGQAEALPGGPGYVTDVNNQGVAVGVLFPYTTVRWEPDGRMTGLDNLPGGSSATPFALNNIGQAVGWAALPEGVAGVAPVIWQSSGAVRRLPNEFPFTTTGQASDINDNGLVVGFVRGVDPPSIAVQWDSNQNDRLSELVPEPGSGDSTTAQAANNLGQVLISSWPRGWYLYGDGLFVPLADLIDGPNGWTDLYAADINDSGTVVGTGRLGGIRRAFVMTPTERFYARR